MPDAIQNLLMTWTVPVPLTLIAILALIFYLRGWRHLRPGASHAIPAWRAGSFFAGVLLIWLAIGSPLALLDEQLLAAHMAQHLLLMTIGPALIWMGAPLLPMLHGLPQNFVQSLLGPFLRWPAAQAAGRILSRPTVCWLAAAAVLVGWHIPAVFNLALQSEGLHVIEHASFLTAGLFFWWPVIQPWPSVPVWPRWSILLYLFAATLPCDILSAYLTFCERVVYPAYLTAPRVFGLSALEDQECAGALMWTCVTLVFLVPAAQITVQLLSPSPKPSELGALPAGINSSGSSEAY